LVQQPYTVDLLQYTDGFTDELVPPVGLSSGLYTEIIIGLTNAVIRVGGIDCPVQIPPEGIMTNVEFMFEVAEGEAIDLTVDFDLSQSIQASGQNSYELDPVFHIIETEKAVAILGEIALATFDWYSSLDAVVIVTTGDEEYTRLVVRPDDPEFIIHSLIPEQDYRIYIDIDGDTETFEFVELVPWEELRPGDAFALNGSEPI
jgi:hypothetical protein